MFDAEIAATLLNRWTVKPPAAHRDSYLDLLREGNLNFTHQMGSVTPGGVTSTSLFELEALEFVDGSRALRLKTPGATPDWTQWAAFEPPVRNTASASEPLSDESYSLEAPER
ncbi:hypothetical protein ACFQ3P_05605 [Paraburkholderia sabiae]|jgi:hypothetical protein|uniref:Lipocalin-like domain-containing protein n=1 Tax=Paraburkholderia sabiae TaxID=273251 RepID=A0ABU9QEA8_9BURK|nr:hypothetical protein [Paraburkholderia sabiae]WJZ76705.1 hypothetical protein QEN71_13170 [Paraburkholderia sabiae]CAD6545931.1 hypothetical protein LMG24235_04232 [Paraburkholderia sabiae]CAG9235355.1 conserved hypothetical protein [Paraburkholderia sabiae]